MCPVMANRPTSKRMAVDYGSTRVYVCCDQCVRTVWREGADKLLARTKDRDILLADVIFDPVSQTRVNEYKAKFQLRDGTKNWLFSSQENLDAFKSDRAIYQSEPKNECLKCRGCGKLFATTGEAGTYQDIASCRLYFCGASCVPKSPDDEILKGWAKSFGETVKTRPVPVPGIKW